MTEAEREQMNELCVQIQQEKSYQRYEDLIRQLQALIAEKENRFPEHQPYRAAVCKILSAVANRVIKPRYVEAVETVEIKITTAEHLYNEIRIDTFTDEKGRTLAIQPGTPSASRSNPIPRNPPPSKNC